MRPKLLVLFPLEPAYREAFCEDFEVLYAPSESTRSLCLQEQGREVFAVLTTGNTGLSAADMAALPSLKLVCAFGAGYENVAVDEARRRGVAVTHSPGANDDSVADHAMALLLALVRDIGGSDRATRQGLWRDDLPLRPALCGKRLGLVGLGNIGAKIARRAAGFDMQIGYHSRRMRADVPYRHFGTARDLAAWADFLVLAAPGGTDTHHMIHEAELQALGAQGFLVNVGRGSLVCTSALEAALDAGGIAGAALDVYEQEPQAPQGLFAFDNVIVTPHVAGSSPEAMWDCTRRCLQNMRQVLQGKAPVSPVP